MFKRCVRYLRQAFNHVYAGLVPVDVRWERAQRRYVSWAGNPMDPRYIEYVKSVGRHFSVFVGMPSRMVDVGCGNGVFAGVSYSEAGYLPLRRGEGYILGVDPLPQLKPIPWLSEFKRGKIEDVKLPPLDAAAFVTTFDHIADPITAIKRLKVAGVKTLYLWETLYHRHTPGDIDHPHHYTYDELSLLLRGHGFRITRFYHIDGNSVSLGCFIEAKTP